MTLRVGARFLTRPFFSPLFEFQNALSRAKHSRAGRKRLHCRLVMSRTMAARKLRSIYNKNFYKELDNFSSAFMNKMKRRKI